MSRVTRSAATGSSRLDAAVAILALASPFVLPVLFVAWLHPAVVANGSATVLSPGAFAAASVAPNQPQSETATATTQPGDAGSGGTESPAASPTVSPTSSPGASPVTGPAPAPATAVPAASAPAGTSSPALGPTLTQPPTATIAGATDVVAEPSLVTGLLLLGGVGVVFLTMGRRPTRGRANDAG